MIYLNKPETAFVTLTALQATIDVAGYFRSKNRSFEFNKFTHLHHGDRLIDQFEYTSEGETYIYYVDVTPVLGRRCEVEYSKVDNPDPHSRYLLSRLLGDAYAPLRNLAQKRRINLSSLEVLFLPHSSKMVSNFIAVYVPKIHEIWATAFKDFDNELFYPILHSYALYKLFIVHQAYHILDKHDHHKTEIDPKYDVLNVKKPGIDCVEFTPIATRTFANEYVNYSFWIHKPRAYRHKKEIRAFLESAYCGINTGVFTLDELKEAVKAAKPDLKTQKSLMNALEKKRKPYIKTYTVNRDGTLTVD